MNRFVVVLMVVAGLVSGSFPSAGAAPPEKPNIVIILADDMGYGDVHALNPASKIATPNIDRLAAEGMSSLRMGVR